MPPEDDLLNFLDDPSDEATPVTGSGWRVLVIDDDPDVHAATRFALSGCDVAGQPLTILSAHSAAEGREVLRANPEVAVLLLDVVMEEDDAGLRFVEWMRAEGYARQRVILRTGQPGYAPELEVIRNYDINDYKSKGELTRTRLITAITTAIRTFEQFRLIDNQRFELERFSYALAHDFKQTTRQILIFSDALTKSASIPSDSPETQALTYLVGAARRLSALIDVLSNYTLLGRPPVIEDFEIETILAEVRDASGPILAQTNGELVVSGAGRCRGNAALIGQVLRILVSNGLEHNESERPRVEVRVEASDGVCMIVVSDNGVGIAEDELEAAFVPHQRLRPSGGLPGTGLGLTMSQRAIEAQGGVISCESRLGSGSVFRVDLPAPPAKAA